MDWNDLTDRLANHLGLEATGSSSTEVDDPLFQFSVDHRLLIGMERQNSGFRLFAELGSLPNSHIDQMRQRMLEANLVEEETKGASFGVNSEGTVYLVRYVDLETLKLDPFLEELTVFIQLAELWQKTLEAEEKEGATMPQLEAPELAHQEALTRGLA